MKAKTKAKAVKVAPSNPCSEIIAAIKATPKSQGWYQIHGEAHRKAIEQLKAEGLIRWAQSLKGYILTEKEAKL